MHNIVQWNCRGLRKNAENLKVLINEINAKVICLQETKLGTNDFNPGLNYNFFLVLHPQLVTMLKEVQLF